MPIRFEGMQHLFDLYSNYWITLGDVLTQMERNGIYVDKQHMIHLREQAILDA